MDDNSPTTKEAAVKQLRVHINACIQEVDTVGSSRALSLVKTKLEEGKMWAGKVFEEMGRELPKQYQDKAE